MPLQPNEKEVNIEISDEVYKNMAEELLTIIVENSPEYQNNILEENNRYKRLIQKYLDYKESIDSNKKMSELERKANDILVSDFQNRVDFLKSLLDHKVSEFSSADIEALTKEIIFEKMLDFSYYQDFNKNSIYELYQNLQKGVNQMFSLSANNNRGYLENALLNDISQMSNKDKAAIYTVKTQKEVYKSIAKRMDENDIAHMIRSVSNNLLKPTFFTREVVNEDGTISKKSNIALGGLNKENIAKLANSVKEIYDIANSRPLIVRIFSVSYWKNRVAINNAKESLVAKGLDSDALDRFVKSSDENRDDLLKDLMDKSNKKIEKLIKDNDKKLKVLSELSKKEEKPEVKEKAQETLDKVEEIDFNSIDLDNELEVSSTNQEFDADKLNITIDLGEDDGISQVNDDFVSDNEEKGLFDEIENNK